MKKRLASIKTDERCNYFSFTHQEYNNLNWIEKHEFRYNGEMYDVLSEEMNNEGVLVYCYHDQKDSWLFNELDEQSSNSSANSGKSKNLQRLLHSISFIYLVPAKWEPIVQEKNNNIPNSISINYTSYFSEVVPPPPKLY